jgi:hypothetical protein
MLIFADSAPRSVDDRDVLFVYRGSGERVREAIK